MITKWEKFELFMQSVFFRVSFVIFFCLFVGVFVYAYYTEKQLVRVGDSAPFATDIARVDDSIEEDDINKAHRTRREMQAWIVEGVSELLNVDATNLDMINKAARPYFTDSAMAQYQAYLQSDNILSDIKADKKSLGAIVDAPPLLLNEGAIGGKYRWLFDVPVIVTVTPLRSGGAPENRRGMLRIQIARTEEGANPDKIVIESWAMNARR